MPWTVGYSLPRRCRPQGRVLRRHGYEPQEGTGILIKNCFKMLADSAVNYQKADCANNK